MILAEFILSCLTRYVNVKVSVEVAVYNQAMDHRYSFRIHEVRGPVIKIADIWVVEICDLFRGFHGTLLFFEMKWGSAQLAQ